jgi:hypothetical protein
MNQEPYASPAEIPHPSEKRSVLQLIGLLLSSLLTLLMFSTSAGLWYQNFRMSQEFDHASQRLPTYITLLLVLGLICTSIMAWSVIFWVRQKTGPACAAFLASLTLFYFVPNVLVALLY